LVVKFLLLRRLSHAESSACAAGDALNQKKLSPGIWQSCLHAKSLLRELTQ
jgi:hypothetical protein